MLLAGRGIAGTVTTVGGAGLAAIAAIAVVIQLFSTVNAIEQAGKGIGLLERLMAAGYLPQLLSKLPGFIVHDGIVGVLEW